MIEKIKNSKVLLVGISFMAGFFLLAALFIFSNGSQPVKQVDKVDKVDQVDQKIQEDREGLKSCLEAAKQQYNDRWFTTCLSYGDEQDCLLSGEISSEYSDDLENARDMCFRFWK